MLEWASALFAALWIVGLAIMLGGISYAVFERAQSGSPLRSILSRPGYEITLAMGATLFALGMAATARGWLALVWLALAGVLAALAWRARQRPVQSSALLVVGLIGLGMTLALLYALTIRPWMQPDEPRHFEVAQHVARLNQPVVSQSDRVLAWEQEIIADMERQAFWWYGYSLVGWNPDQLPASFDEIWGAMYSTAFFQSPLYYTLSGIVIGRWGAGWALSDAVLALRLLGIVCLGVALAGVYQVFRELLPDRPRLVLAALALSALWPALLAASASVNNDVLVMPLVIWSLYFGVRLLRRGPTLGVLTALLVLGLLAALTKRSGLIALGILPIALTLWALGRVAAQRKPRYVVAAAGVILVAGVVGFVTVAAAVRANLVQLPVGLLDNLASGALWREFLTLPFALFTDTLLRTAVGWFGWLRVPLPAPFYWLGGLLVILALIGLLWGAIRPPAREMAGWQRRVMVLFAAALVLQIGLVFGKELLYGTWKEGSLPQARYLFPVLPALLTPFLLGLDRLVPERIRPAALPALIILLLAFNVYILAGLLYPFFWL